MPVFGPISRNNLIKCLRKAGYEGPYSGSKHQFMRKENLTIRIPDPHRGDISKSLLIRILRQAKINKQEWESL